MKKVLYTKYNSFRKKEYQIKTTLYEENEKKYVSKKALNKETVSHIERIYSNSEVLRKLYNSVEILPCKLDGDELIFDFVQGKTLLDEISYDFKDIDELVSVINEKLGIVFDIDDRYICKFELSEKFSDVFPECIPDAVDAYSVSNLDSNLDNFIINDKKFYCIDYEWVADFDIPIDYLKYRVLLYFYISRRPYLEKVIGLNDFIERFGISEDSQALYFRMEHCFQLYVTKSNNDLLFPVSFYKKSTSLIEMMNAFEENKVLRNKSEQIESELKSQRALIDSQNRRIEEMRRSVKNPIYGIRRLVRNRMNKK